MRGDSRADWLGIALRVSAIVAVTAWAMMALISLVFSSVALNMQGTGGGDALLGRFWTIGAAAMAIGLAIRWRSRLAAQVSLVAALAVMGLVATEFAIGTFAESAVILFVAPVVAAAASAVLTVGRSN